MRLVVLGNEAEVLGFALAGIEGVVCETPTTLERALEWTAQRSTEVALVAVSGPTYALEPAAVERLRDSPAGPLVIVLPSLDCTRDGPIEGPVPGIAHPPNVWR